MAGTEIATGELVKITKCDDLGARVSDFPSWEKRLRWLAGNEKTPRTISEDLIYCFQELDDLRHRVNSR